MCVSISLKCIPVLSIPFSSALHCWRLSMSLSEGHLQALSHRSGSCLTTGHVRLFHKYFIIPSIFERGLPSNYRTVHSFSQKCWNIWLTTGTKDSSRRYELIQTRHCEAVTVNIPPAYRCLGLVQKHKAGLSDTVRAASESLQNAGWSLTALSASVWYGELLFDSPDVLSLIPFTHHLISSLSVVIVFGVCFYI